MQRIFSILKGEQDLDEETDEHSIYELPTAEPVEVAYNPSLPPDEFDVIIIDECHRSIYRPASSGVPGIAAGGRESSEYAIYRPGHSAASSSATRRNNMARSARLTLPARTALVGS